MLGHKNLNNITIEKSHEIAGDVVLGNHLSTPLRCVDLRYLQNNNLGAALFFDFIYVDDFWEKVSELYAKHGELLVTVNLDTYYSDCKGVQNPDDAILGNYFYSSAALTEVLDDFVYSDRLTVSSDKKVIMLNHFSDFIIFFAEKDCLRNLVGSYFGNPSERLNTQLENEDIPLESRATVTDTMDYYSAYII